MTEQKKLIIGYSGFDMFEECYGYDENACYIADAEAAAERFMRVASMTGQFRIEPVTLSRIMDDFGYSLGEFAMERKPTGLRRVYCTFRNPPDFERPKMGRNPTC